MPPTAAPGPAREIVRGGCAHDCPDSCAWLVEVEGGVAVSIRGDPDHPFTRGALCAKVARYLDRVYSPQRLLQPLRRTGPKGDGRFEQVTWEVALDAIAARLGEVCAREGPEAILPYSFAGNMGLVQSRSLDRRLWSRLGTSRLARTVCGGTANAGLSSVLGSTLGALPGQLRHSRYIVLWGTNTLVTNAHLWPLIREARAAGARLVVIDPLRTRTAAAADWHLQPLPGTDVALALALINVIVTEGLEDRDYIDRCTTGFEELSARARQFPPERAAALTGLAAADIARLGRELATLQPAAIRTVLGLEKHPQGAAAFGLLASLPAVTGAWRHLGGGLFPDTRAVVDEALDVAAVTRPDLEPRTRVVNMIQLGRALTDSQLRPRVRALFVYNANPAVTAPNSDLVVRGLQREDLFTVVSEQFLTDTARYADYVLPATTMLEHLDLLYPWGHTSVVLNRPAIRPQGQAIANTELFRRLAHALGLAEDYLFESDEALVRTALQSGHPWLREISFERLWERGWMELAIDESWLPYAEGGFRTRSGRCELPAPADPPPASSVPGYPLRLLSTKSSLHFLNSSYAHLPRHRRAEEPPAVHLHAADARVRAIGDGELVRVRSAQGSVTLQARLDGFVRPGVVAIPFGWWRDHADGGANSLTTDGLSDLGGGGDFYSTSVEVEAVSSITASTGERR
jgi:anaerobic selenocysteine-containing dehydrogenase